MKVLIAGGGIGGITAALCLAKLGHSVEVFEQFESFSEIGAGIQLSPNCSRVLHYLGLQADLKQKGFLPEGTEIRHWKSGKLISESKLGDHATEKFGAPYYHIHRGDLLAILVKAATAHPGISLHTDSKLTRISNTDYIVEAETHSGHYTGEVLIGADGIHSLTRDYLWEREQPTFTGNVAWRSLVPTKSLPKGLIPPTASVWWGPGKHFVHYYVKGGEFVNCVCVIEKNGWEVESWTALGSLSELKSDFYGWHNTIQTLIAHSDEKSLYKWALFDRPPMKQWGSGRISLLGDACHPTLPFMAQGAAMAIEDAAVLAACLSNGDKVEIALQRYEDLRRGRTAGVQKGSRRNARVFHMSGLKAWARNLAAGRASDSVMADLYRYDVFDAVKS